MSAKNITVKNFREEVLNAQGKVLLDFWAPWCGPCRMVVPIVEEIAEENPQIVVGKINIDQEPELANQFDVLSIPTLIVVENGKILKRSVGARPKEEILDML